VAARASPPRRCSRYLLTRSGATIEEIAHLLMNAGLLMALRWISPELLAIPGIPLSAITSR